MMISCVLWLLSIWVLYIANSRCRKVGKKFRWPAPHAIIIHCGTELASIVPLNTLRTHTFGVYQKPNPISIQWLRHPNANHIILHYRSIPCLKTLVGSVRYHLTLLKYSLFFTLLRYTQQFYNAELHLKLTHFLEIPYLIKLLSTSEFQYIAEI